MPVVLVVDDDSQVRDALRDELERAGYTVVEAWSGRQAVAKLEEHQLDVVVLDTMVRWLGGHELLALVRETQPSLPVVVFSSVVHEPDVAELLARLGATRLCDKSDAHRVVETIQELLGNPS